MELYTVQMSKWRIVAQLGIVFLDTTVKTGKGPFAPTWDMVSKVKSGEITQEEYTNRYTALMRESYRNNKDYWLHCLSNDKLAIACYCPDGCFCHRYLLRDMLQAVSLANNIPFKYMGEIK